MVNPDPEVLKFYQKCSEPKYSECNSAAALETNIPVKFSSN
jgi:hypothetical protein